MSRIGKASLLLAGLVFLAVGVARFIIGWQNFLYIPLALSVLAVIFAVIKDFATYKEFMTMRTTKHGMNMGVLILLALVLLVTLNFFSVRYDRKFDWTMEGLNSLSDQSMKILNAVDDELQVTLLSRKDQNDEGVRRRVQELVDMYRVKNKHVKFAPFNVMQRPDLAQKFNFRDTQSPFGLFVEYKGKNARVDQATEEGMTKALVRVTRTGQKSLYFVTGHGEADLDGQTPESLSELKLELNDLYQVRPLKLYETLAVPEDAAAVIIAGPRREFSEVEMKAVRKYAREGGRLLIAADPGERHNMARLMKSFGVEFQNNYVLDLKSRMTGTGLAMALGTRFSGESEATKAMMDGKSVTAHYISSALKKAPDADPSFKFDEIVSTDENTVTTNELKDGQLAVTSKGPHVLGMSVTGKLPPEPGEDAKKEDAAKEFTTLIFGDSDFMTNQILFQLNDRDLVLNSIAQLTQDNDLISIRPKMPAGSTLVITETQKYLFLFGFLLPLPIVMFFGGGFIWYRRKTA